MISSPIRPILALAAAALVSGCGLIGPDPTPTPVKMAPTPTVVLPTPTPVVGATRQVRHTHTGTLLEDGRVLIVGGFDDDFVPVGIGRGVRPEHRAMDGDWEPG